MALAKVYTVTIGLGLAATALWAATAHGAAACLFPGVLSALLLFSSGDR